MDGKRFFSLFVLFLYCCVTIASCDDKKCRKKHVKVAIIGAGASGIAAAQTLYNDGMKDFVVLEGKDYIGGRIHHVPFQGNLVPLGAGWIHVIGPNNPIWKLAQDNFMQVHHDNYTDVIVRDGEDGQIYENAHQMYSDLKKIVNKVDDKVVKRNKISKFDVPMRSTLSMLGWHANTKLKNAMEFYTFDFELGISPKVISSSFYGVTGEGDDVIVTDKRGYAHMLEVIAKPFLKKIFLNAIVTEIKHADSMVMLKMKDGSLYTADHVLITVSSGVLSNNLIHFYPRLPEWKIDAINLVPMCYYCKIFFKFPKRFWDDVNYILLAQKDRGSYVHWQNFDRPTLLDGEHVLLLTLTEDHCLRSEKLTDQQIEREAMDTLRKVYGNNIPSPTAMIRNKWNIDPMTMGAYSNHVVGFQKSDYKRLQAPVGHLWFAGEYSVKDYGYVHGAYKSGEVMAKKMIKCLRKHQCPNYVEEKASKCIKAEE